MTPFTAEVAAARRAQAAWAARTVPDRLRHIRNLRALLVERMDDIGEAIRADIARPAVEIAGTEVLPTAAALKFLEKRAARILAPRRVSWWDQPTWLMGNRDAVHHRPWGVVGIIGTWNYPIFLNVGQMAQALVAGNAVLWKPSENTPRTAEVTTALFRAAGFPPDLLQTLPATREAGPQLAEADVDHVVFTGSDTVGRHLAKRLGERLIPSTLELSGCDAMFVLADANLDMAVKAAWFGLTINRGQTCIAVRRVFVQRARCEAFVAALAPLLARAEPMGLVTDGQRAQAEKLIADAVARGARQEPTPPAPLPKGKGEEETRSLALAASTAGAPGGAERSEASDSPFPLGRGAGGVGSSRAGGRGSSLPPTLLVDTPADAAICREACFAPVAAVIPFDTVEEALALAKESPFGLSASVFGADAGAAAQVAARVPSGSVIVNDVLAPTAHPATPFGGRGRSGWGTTQGVEGLLAMTTPQVMTVHAGTFRPHLDDAVNPDPATGDILRGLIRWTHGRGVRAKLGGLWQMVKGIRRKGKK